MLENCRPKEDDTSSLIFELDTKGWQAQFAPGEITKAGHAHPAILDVVGFLVLLYSHVDQQGQPQEARPAASVNGSKICVVYQPAIVFLSIPFVELRVQGLEKDADGLRERNDLLQEAQDSFELIGCTISSVGRDHWSVVEMPLRLPKAEVIDAVVFVFLTLCVMIDVAGVLGTWWTGFKILNEVADRRCDLSW
jgi:hypothetical protein